MLIGIAPCISPELLAVLHRMGHGDEIVLADAFFPGESCNPRTLRADGIRVAELLDGVLALIKPDGHDPAPFLMMQPVPGDPLDPGVEREYRTVIDRHWPASPPIARLERFAFYERARRAFAVVMTGETAPYGNLIVKKGVIPAAPGGRPG